MLVKADVIILGLQCLAVLVLRQLASMPWLLKMPLNLSSLWPRDAVSMTLQDLAKSLHNCQRCKLSKPGRAQVVLGVGNPLATIMFVGEAPGFYEDQQGEPFE